MDFDVFEVVGIVNLCEWVGLFIYLDEFGFMVEEMV